MAAVAEVAEVVEEVRLHEPDEEQEQTEQPPEAEAPSAEPTDPEPIVEGEVVPEELGGEAKLFPEPVEPSPPTPIAQDPSDLYANFYQELREAQVKADSLKSRAAQLKAEAKFSEETAKNAQAEVESLLRRGPVLFAEHKATAAVVVEEGKPEVAHTDEPTAEAVVEVEDESWKGTPLTELSIPSKILDHLAEGRLTTLGELATFTSDPFNKLTDLKGIGEKAAEKVEAALEKFWQQRKSDQSI